MVAGCTRYPVVTCAFQRACSVQSAASFMENDMSEWISVEDGLPDSKTQVLVYWRPVDYKDRPFHREIIIAELSRMETKWWANNRYYSTVYITHWMPLPEPPETRREGLTEL